MARLFITDKEKCFFDSINKELLQKIVSQKVIYYSVSEEKTNVHRLYDEAIRKTVYNPVEVNALVLYQDPQQSSNQFSVDTVYNVEVYFGEQELAERNVVPREGDFLKFGTILYEIARLTRPQITFGQIETEVMLKAECIVSRKSNLEILDEIEGI